MIETGSSLGCYMACPRKYSYRYEKLVEYPKFSKSREFGTLVHAFKEGEQDNALADMVEKFPSNRDDISLWYDIAKHVSGLHRHFYQEQDEQCKWDREVEWSFKVGDHHLAGKTDAVMMDKNTGAYYVYELKTSTMMAPEDYERMLQNNMQIRNNVIGISKLYNAPIAGVVYDVIFKPNIYKRKNEDDVEWASRFIDMIGSEPGKYFHRISFSLNDNELVKHSKHLEDYFTNVATGFRGKNTSNCHAYFSECEYYDICVDDLDPTHGATKRKSKHSELSPEIQCNGF